MMGELFLAVLLGLRHATDPDHVTAVATLVLDREGGARRAGVLGLAWGAGHAAALCALGLPLVLAGIVLPEGARNAVEAGIGVVIAALAVRLLVRWRRGVLHSHPHVHGGRVHAHPHAHGHRHAGVEAAGAAPGNHDHPHGAALGRSPLGALGIGALHGVGGSAAAGVLVVAAAPGPGAALAALALFAFATAVSMAAASWLFGLLVAPAARRVEALVPAFGVAALVFGVAYALGAA